jgi:hypothetical protein
MSHPHIYGHHPVRIAPVVPIMPLHPRPVVVVPMGPGVGMRRGYHGRAAMHRPIGRPIGGRRRG